MTNIMKDYIYKHPALSFILITMLFMLWGKLMILPTFDDWNTLSSPNYDPDFLKYIMPYGYIWRPFDAIMGYIVAIDYRLFPKLNHLIIFAGHITNVFLLYKICKKVGFGKAAANIAAIYFYISPCMLATVFSCDSLNQTYSQLWGLAAILSYLSLRGKARYTVWFVTIFIAALAKDNGIAFAVIPPVVAFAFGMADRKTLVRHFMFGIFITVVYAVIRLSLPSTYIENPDYSTFDPNRKFKEIAMLFGYSLSATDYISLLHAPSRNFILAATTFITSFPFIYLTLIRNIKIWKDKTFLLIIVCAFIALSPNLLISLSIMNTYAGLAMVSMLIGYAVEKNKCKEKTLNTAFILYVLTALVVDVHHWYMSYTTSLTGKEMAVRAIEKTGSPIDKVYVIIIEDDYPRFSSFCVVPSDAFGWGMATQHENGYKWPKEICDTIIARKDSAQTDVIRERAFDKGFECVWTVNRKEVNVARK